jgi:hypothetical protein
MLALFPAVFPAPSKDERDLRSPSDAFSGGYREIGLILADGNKVCAP